MDSYEHLKAHFDRIAKKNREDHSALRTQRDELLSAIKGYKTILKPWLDGAVGKKVGSVTYAEWETAVDRLETAIAKAEREP